MDAGNWQPIVFQKTAGAALHHMRVARRAAQSHDPHVYKAIRHAWWRIAKGRTNLVIQNGALPSFACEEIAEWPASSESRV
jgi:hypothetical protein